MYIRVKAQPGAKKEKIEKISEDHFDIAVKEKAERNMANNRILEIMRREFPGKSVRMISGHHSPSKIVSID